jgi:hypothetical protein
MRKFMSSIFTKREDPKDKAQREEYARVEKEKRDYFKKQDERRYKNLLKTKGYTDSKLSKMSDGDLSDLYDLHSKIMPRHMKEMDKDRELERQMAIIQEKASRQRELEGNARKYLKSINEFIPGHLTGKEIQDIADLKVRLRKLRNIPQDHREVGYTIGKMPAAPTHKPVTKKGGKKKKRKGTQKNKKRNTKRANKKNKRGKTRR